jgi:hypothetical protein
MELGGWFGKLWRKFWFWWYGRRHMLRLGIIGDLSLQPPDRLQRAMAAAFGYSDIIIQVGDMHPGYSVLRTYKAMEGGQKYVLAVPGNHDTNWDQELGWARNWYRAFQFPDGTGMACHIVGLDNSADVFDPTVWSMLGSVPKDTTPLLMILHKPLSTVVLPDGSETNHIMGEGNLPNADAERLKHLLESRENVLYIHGHYHAFALMKCWYGDALIEGRGGAAGTGTGELGWTQILLTKEGLTLHRVDL